MNFVEMATELIRILVSGIGQMATGIGSGLNDLVTNIFTVSNGETTTLSVVAGVTAVFGAIAISVGLGRKVVSWVMSLGARN